jgi:hypothetical protein
MAEALNENPAISVKSQCRRVKSPFGIYPIAGAGAFSARFGKGVV